MRSQAQAENGHAFTSFCTGHSSSSHLLPVLFTLCVLRGYRGCQTPGAVNLCVLALLPLLYYSCIDMVFSPVYPLHNFVLNIHAVQARFRTASCPYHDTRSSYIPHFLLITPSAERSCPSDILYPDHLYSRDDRWRWGLKVHPHPTQKACGMEKSAYIKRGIKRYAFS